MLLSDCQQDTLGSDVCFSTIQIPSEFHMLSNLQQMAKTVAYIQEHGYQSEEDLADAFQKAQAQASQVRKDLRKTEQDLKSVNKQIHYTGQYLANKSIYKQYLGSKNKKKFCQEHQSEITLYETVRKVLKEHADGGKLPSMGNVAAILGKDLSRQAEQDRENTRSK